MWVAPVAPGRPTLRKRPRDIEPLVALEGPGRRGAAGSAVRRSGNALERGPFVELAAIVGRQDVEGHVAEQQP